MNKVTNWLVKNGFTITKEYNSIGIMEFSKENIVYEIQTIFSMDKVIMYYLYKNINDETGTIIKRERYGAFTQGDIIECIKLTI